MVESFEAREQERADGGRLDYRISSGKSLKKRDRRNEMEKEEGAKGRPLKNYQTFNEEESS